MPKQSIQYYKDRFNDLPDEVKLYGAKHRCDIFPDDISDENLPLLKQAIRDTEKPPILIFRHQSDPGDSGTHWVKPAYEAFIQLAESCPTLTAARISYIDRILINKLTEQLAKNKNLLKDREAQSKKDKPSAELEISQSTVAEESKPSALRRLSFTSPMREPLSDQPGGDAYHEPVHSPSHSL